MTDKHKHLLGSQGYYEIKTAKNYINPSLNSPFRPGGGGQPNGSATYESCNPPKPSNPIGASFSSAQYLKNYSSNTAHYYDRIDNLKDNRKKEQNPTFSNLREGASELRSSVPVNYTKKPDIQFLRNTTLTPKPKGFYEGQYNYNEKWNQSANTESHEHKPIFNRVPYSPKFDGYLKSDQWQQNWRSEKYKQEKEIKDMKVAEGLKQVNDSKDTKETSSYKELRESKQPLQSKPTPYSPASISPKSPILSQPDEKTPIKNSIKLNEFSIGRSLGVGKFAEVFLAKHNASGFVLVLKRLSKQKVKQYQMESQVIQEIKIHAFLSHPNIVQFYGVFNDEKYIYLMLEYLQSGTLFDYIGDKYYLEEKQAVFFLRQICAAVKYLHNKGIAHRDIKPENIIISYGLVKLCDFGWSARVLTSRKTYCGTFSYAPPEIHERKEYDETVDLWCIGVLAYELLTNQVPFDHKDRKVTIQKITSVDRNRMQFPENISLRARDFIESLLRKNPEERLKAYKMLEHPFLKQYQEES